MLMKRRKEKVRRTMIGEDRVQCVTCDVQLRVCHMRCAAKDVSRVQLRECHMCS